ncbi:hypothetical protein HC028_02970 [Planosporangium flavigriseum]|nr:hypothetical protein [Planosporangium flavigriseum]NJC63477.1 hypothetical protein [Planosporangium flavigriseum]
MDDAYTGARAPAAAAPVRQAVGEATDAATEAAGNVTDTAKQQARQVTDEVSSQARGVAAELRDQVGTQVRSQNDRLVDGIRSMADELDGMVSDGTDSPARTVVSRVALGGRQMADYLAEHGPEGVLSEVQDFARRRPGAFLATALATGFVVGRLGKGAFSATTETSQSSTAGAPGGEAVRAEDIPRMRAESYSTTYPTTTTAWGPENPKSTSVSAEPPLSATARDYPTAASEPDVGTEYLATGTGRPTAVTQPIGAGTSFERGVSDGSKRSRVDDATLDGPR